jgi:hypothetical protein
MFRALAAFAAVAVLGLIGAGRASVSDAQETQTRRVVQRNGGPVIIETEEMDEVQARGGGEFVPPRPGRQGNQGQPGMPGMGGGPEFGMMMGGGWTIHDTRQGAILLNAMTGESFMLREGKDGGMRWQPIERPQPERREGPQPDRREGPQPRQPDRPRTTEPAPRPDREQPANPEQARKRIEAEIEKVRANLEEKLEDLRAKSKGTKNKDERRKIAEAIEEVEDALQRLEEKRDEALRRWKEENRKKAPDKDRD